MIKSITVNGHKITGPNVRIESGSNISVYNKGNHIHIKNNALFDNKYESYMATLRGMALPYMKSISGVTADDAGNIWILGSKTSQVDVGSADSDTAFTVCDMGPVVDYRRIYNAVYAMLRQIRLWLDGHKDTLLLKDAAANTRWATMRSAEDDGTPTMAMFKETRNRSEIPAIGKGLNLINEYRGIVTLWNHIVSTLSSDVSIRLHPADKAGLYIGVNFNVPVVDKSDSSQSGSDQSGSDQSGSDQSVTKITVRVTLSIKGQPDEGMDNLYLWMRCPVARSIPYSGDVDINLPGESATSAVASVLDDNSKQIKLSADDDIVLETSISIPDDELRTYYSVHVIFEAIPFILCTEEESTYVDSKKAVRYSVLDENIWTIKTEILRNDTSIKSVSNTKRTTMVSVCDDPNASNSSDSSVPEDV